MFFAKVQKHGEVMSESVVRVTLVSLSFLKLRLKRKIHAYILSHLHKDHNETKYFEPKCRLLSKNLNLFSRDNALVPMTSLFNHTPFFLTSLKFRLNVTFQGLIIVSFEVVAREKSSSCNLTRRRVYVTKF